MKLASKLFVVALAIAAAGATLLVDVRDRCLADAVLLTLARVALDGQRRDVR